MVVGLLGNKSPGSNRFILVTPKPENGVQLQAKLVNQNPTGLSVGAVRSTYGYCRVSTPKQNIERQVYNILKSYPAAEIIKEEYTGTKLDRPEWSKLYPKRLSMEGLSLIHTGNLVGIPAR